MDSIRIERLHCLSDTGNIQIKPVTVLLGQNSSGKSTFLRVFPLLKQSVESRKTGPILWNDRLVDFGDYEEAHQYDSEDGISFHFTFKIESDELAYAYVAAYQRSIIERNIQLLDNITVSLMFRVVEDKKKETTRINELSLLFEDSKIQIRIKQDGRVSSFKVNSLDVLGLGNKYTSRRFGSRGILPSIEEVEQNKDADSTLLDLFTTSSGRLRYSRFRTLLERLVAKTKSLVHSSTSPDTVLKMALSYAVGSSSSMIKEIKNNHYAPKSWNRRTQSWTIETPEFRDLRDLIIANAVPVLIEKCDEVLSSFSAQIRYMGPVRATADRYYRTQDLAVDEVDYRGQNLPMFLRNLTELEWDRFKSWTMQNFGFEPSIEANFGHISLKIRPANSNRSVNLTDTGFGFSQILPVITQLWSLSEFGRRELESISRRRIRNPVIFAIEQPELHLHPRLQGSLTDVLVKATKVARAKKVDLRLVIETHSESLVNRLGHLVARGVISHEDINIVLFEQSDESGSTSVRTSEFDSEGYLSNWPIGFFEMQSEWDILEQTNNSETS